MPVERNQESRFRYANEQRSHWQLCRFGMALNRQPRSWWWSEMLKHGQKFDGYGVLRKRKSNINYDSVLHTQMLAGSLNYPVIKWICRRWTQFRTFKCSFSCRLVSFSLPLQFSVPLFLRAISKSQSKIRNIKSKSILTKWKKNERWVIQCRCSCSLIPLLLLSVHIHFYSFSLLQYPYWKG